MTDPNSMNSGYCYFCGTRDNTEFCINCGHEIGSYPKEIEALLLESRIDEHQALALDHYVGHTFSENTDYKDKFEKFVENNERMIKKLSALQKGEIE